jgi:hypothetical protein
MAQCGRELDEEAVGFKLVLRVIRKDLRRVCTYPVNLFFFSKAVSGSVKAESVIETGSLDMLQDIVMSQPSSSMV